MAELDWHDMDPVKPRSARAPSPASRSRAAMRSWRAVVISLAADEVFGERF